MPEDAAPEPVSAPDAAAPSPAPLSMSAALDASRPADGTPAFIPEPGDNTGPLAADDPADKPAPEDKAADRPAEAVEAAPADPDALPPELADNPFVRGLWEREQERQRQEQAAQQQRAAQAQQGTLDARVQQAAEAVKSHYEALIQSGQMSLEEAQPLYEAEVRAASAEARAGHIEQQAEVARWNQQFDATLGRPEFKAANPALARSIIIVSGGQVSIEDAARESARQVAAIEAAAITRYEKDRAAAAPRAPAPIPGGGAVAAPSAPTDFARLSISDALRMSRPQARH